MEYDVAGNLQIRDKNYKFGIFQELIYIETIILLKIIFLDVL